MQDTLIAPVTEPEVVPDLDPAVLEEVGDEILLEAVHATKIAKVRTRAGRNENRAWSFGGNVD